MALHLNVGTFARRDCLAEDASLAPSTCQEPQPVGKRLGLSREGNVFKSHLIFHQKPLTDSLDLISALINQERRRLVERLCIARFENNQIALKAVTAAHSTDGLSRPLESLS